ncbi:hypothetical protein JCM10295v2_007170, partial [Rhodotorula toruloides]
MATLIRPTPVRPRAVEPAVEVAIAGLVELKDADAGTPLEGGEGVVQGSETAAAQSEGGPAPAQAQEHPQSDHSPSSANIPSLAAPVPMQPSTHSSPRTLHTRPIQVPPRRTLSAPAPIALFRPRPLSRASKSPSFTPPDSALEELLEIFSSSPAMSALGTPHRASSERTILLPSRASGIRSRGPGYGRESAAHGHGHGRKRSSGEGSGAGAAGGTCGGRRTPPV